MLTKTNLTTAFLLVAGIALMGVGRAEVSMPLLFCGQVLTLLGSRQSGLKVLVGLGFSALMISASLVFYGSAHELFGGTGRFLVAMAVGTALNLVGWLVDRWAVPRLPRWAAPLVFPAIRTPIEVAAALAGPYGVWGSFAAPAAGLWPISGLVALGGFSLLSFVLLWLASSSALFWQGAVFVRRSRPWLVLAPCLVVLLVANVVLAAISPKPGPVVRVGAVAAPELSQAYTSRSYDQLEAYGHGTLDPSVTAALRAASLDTATQTLRAVEQAADRGARIVYTGEGDVKVLDLDLPLVEQMASRTARAHGIWLGLGVHEFRRAQRPLANMILLFAPDGRLASQYEKTHPIGDEASQMLIGDGHPGGAQTPMARIAGVICYDTEFLSYTRSIARAGADILFAPSNDWPQIASIRAAVTRFRALETGMALVRPTRNGVSEIVAPDGRILASAPYDASQGVVLVANVPARAVPTLYARLGDWPGAASLLLLCVLCLGAAWGGYRARAAPQNATSRSTSGSRLK